jgi:hypothetical protein
MKDCEISDYNYIGSSIGNAYFSGVSFDQLWECVLLASTREELDFAITSTIKLNELVMKGIDYER